MKGFKYVLLCLYGLSVTREIHGYSTGAISVACGSMKPSHGVESQNTTNPYKLILSRTTVEQNNTIEITLTSKSGKDEFKGFFIQIKKEGVTNKSFGEFDEYIGSLSARPVACYNKHNNAMTHISAEPKTSVVLQWVADTDVGEYRIHTTFVKDFKTMWVNQKHEDIIRVIPESPKSRERITAKKTGSLEMPLKNDRDWDALCSNRKLDPTLEAESLSSNAYEMQIAAVNGQVGQSEKMVINVASPYDTPILEMFIQVKKSGQLNEPRAYGKFTKMDIHSKDYKLVDCFGSQESAVLFYNHEHPNIKISDVAFQWVSPDDLDGEFEVVATALSSETTFWDKVGEHDSTRRFKVVKQSASSSVTINRLSNVATKFTLVLLFGFAML